MHTTVGIQAHRTAGWRLPPGAVLVSRTSRWGNPFTVDSILAGGDAATRGEARAIAVRRHEAWLDGEGPDTYRISSRLQVSRARVNDEIGQLTGRVLACPCPVDELPCHRDTLARRAAERGVYAERAQLIALIAAHYRAELFSDPNEPVRADVVYGDTPAGQLSWHLAATDVAAYFTSIKRAQPHQAQPWDGHSTEEKGRRIHELTQRLAGDRAITHPDRLGTPNRHRPPRASSTGPLYGEAPLLNSRDWEHITEALNWLAVCVEEDPKGWPELSPEAIEATWEKTVVQLPATSRLLPQPPPSPKTSHQ